MIYVVRPGDTLLGIARRFGIPTQDLARINQLSDPNRLVVGQALLLDQEPSGPWNAISNGYAYPDIGRRRLRDCLEQLTSLSIFSYGFTADGTLLPPERDPAPMLREAGAADVDCALVLTPFGRDGRFNSGLITALLNSQEAQTSLLNQLAAELERNRYAELNLDFEFIRGEEREAYVDFVALAAQRLPVSVTVCVAPKTNAAQKGLLYEGKDYRGLGEAADRVMLMTYEWGYTFGPPMAVAPYEKVKQVLDYAVSEIPREKLLLGLANYGYDWKLPYIKGTTAARTIGNLEAVELAGEQGSEIFYDPEARSPWFVYTDRGGTHEVWFEDVRSWSEKLRLVRTYGLGGVSIWQLMRPNRPGLTLLGTILRNTGKQRI